MEVLLERPMSERLKRCDLRALKGPNEDQHILEELDYLLVPSLLKQRSKFWDHPIKLGSSFSLLFCGGKGTWKPWGKPCMLPAIWRIGKLSWISAVAAVLPAKNLSSQLANERPGNCEKFDFGFLLEELCRHSVRLWAPILDSVKSI